MYRSKFAYLSLIGLGALLAFLMLFPGILSFLVHAAMQGRSCEGSEGGCGALATVIATFVKPSGIVVIGAFLTWIVSRRLNFLEFGGAWTTVAALWLLASIPYLVAARNFWGANFSLGLLYVPLPFLLAYLVVFVTFLYFVKYAPANAPDLRQQKAWLIVMVSTCYTLLISVPDILTGISTIPYVGSYVNMKLPLVSGQIAVFLRLGLPQSLVLALGFLVLTGALAYIIYCQNRIEGALASPQAAEKPALGTPVAKKPSNRSFGQRKTV